MTIQSVANDLRLNSDLIQALESSDTDNLPAKIFVMGYLRSYARYLGVDESELKQLDLSVIEQTVDVKTSFSGKPEKNSKAFSIRMMTYLVTIGMLALLAAWWLSMQPNLSEIAAVESYQQGEVSSDVFELPQQTSERSALDGEEIHAPEAETVTVVESGVNDEPSGMEQEQISDEAPVAPEAVAVEDDIPDVIIEPVAQSELNITYLDDSWTEVSDANESRLLYGLYKKGREVSVQGVAPFSLFFGYAPGVVVTHNEEQFEHITFHRNGMARFKVGTAEDNHLPSE